MTPTRNLIAGLASSIWIALIGLAVVPFYLKYLGIEAYGLIGFFVTTQAVMSLLDLGMAPTISREVARCSATGILEEAGKLLHTLAVVYWAMAAAIALLILVLSPFIAGYWLQSKQLSPQTINHSVVLMGLVIASRWPLGLYQGALIGAQRITVSSVINMVMATFGGLGAVVVLVFVSPTIEAFFIWQICIGFVSALIMRAAAWRIVGRASRNRFDVDRLKSVWRFTAGLSGIAVSAAIFTQQDKLILSKTLGLEGFGQYMLATVVVSSLYMIITPIYNVIYPKLSALVASGDTVSIKDTYRFGTRVFTPILFSTAMVLVISSEVILLIWTDDLSIAKNVAPVISLLAIGSALHGVMFFPYALQLSYGNVRLPLMTNAILMIVAIPINIFMSIYYGALGGAMAWLILHVLYFFLGTWITHRKYLKGDGAKWMLQDVLTPLGVVTVFGLFGFYVLHDGGYSSWERLMLAVALAVMATALSFAQMPKSYRTVLLQIIK